MEDDRHTDRQKDKSGGWKTTTDTRRIQRQAGLDANVAVDLCSEGHELLCIWLIYESKACRLLSRHDGNSGCKITIWGQCGITDHITQRGNLTPQTMLSDGFTLDKLKTVLLPEKPFVIMIASS